MKFIYLFEDYKDDKLSAFFRRGFSEGTDYIFEYSNGNANLLKKAQNIIDINSFELLIIFIDLVPNNSETAIIFGELCKLAIENLGKVFVVPTLGSEYYFIKSLRNKGIERNTELLKTYCNVIKYDEICSRHFGNRVKESSYSTFEKFGKLLLSNNFESCINKPNKNIVEHKSGRNYYECSCPCQIYKPKGCKYSGDELRLSDKIRDELVNYYVIPIGSRVGGIKKKVDMNRAFELIDNYLNWVIEKAEVEFKMGDEIRVYKNVLEQFKKLRRMWKC